MDPKHGNKPFKKRAPDFPNFSTLPKVHNKSTTPEYQQPIETHHFHNLNSILKPQSHPQQLHQHHFHGSHQQKQQLQQHQNNAQHQQHHPQHPQRPHHSLLQQYLQNQQHRHHPYHPQHQQHQQHEQDQQHQQQHQQHPQHQPLQLHQQYQQTQQHQQQTNQPHAAHKTHQLHQAHQQQPYQPHQQPYHPNQVHQQPHLEYQEHHRHEKHQDHQHHEQHRQQHQLYQPQTAQYPHQLEFRTPKETQYAIERAITLNIWTHTEFIDSPSPCKDKSIHNLEEYVKELEECLKLQVEVIDRLREDCRKTLTPCNEYPNSTTTTPPIKTNNAGISYQTLSQYNEVTREPSTKVEHNDDAIPSTSNLNYSYDSDTLSSHSSDSSLRSKENKMLEALDSVIIGPNETKLPAYLFEQLTWTSPSRAVISLLTILFERRTLATYSLCGKPPFRGVLDKEYVDDIIFFVTRKCNVSETEVRKAIQAKCEEENKLFVSRLNLK